MGLFTEEQIEKANSISIMDYLHKAGYHPVKTGGNYELKGYGGLQIDPRGNQWNCRSNPSYNAKGGPIQLVQFLENMNWKEAVAALINEEGMFQPVDASSKEYTKQKKEFSLPEKNNTYQHMFAYLIKTRKIDSEIVKNLVEKKLIYENNKKSCVFVGKDKDGTVKYASIRSTNTIGDPFKGEAAGSDKRYGFCIPGEGDTLTVFEAPIDALSYLTIFKIQGAAEAIQNETLLCLGGVEDLALERYLGDHPNIKKIRMALDMDDAGKRGSENIAKKYGGSYEIKRLVLPCKDYNQYLIENYDQIVTEKKEEHKEEKKEEHKEEKKENIETEQEIKKHFECYALKENENGKYIVMALKSNQAKIMPITWPIEGKEKAEVVLESIVSKGKAKGICIEKLDSMKMLNRFYEVITNEMNHAEREPRMEFEQVQ